MWNLFEMFWDFRELQLVVWSTSNLPPLCTWSFNVFYSVYLRATLTAAAGVVHHTHMVNDSVGKCEFPGWKISCTWVSSETHIPMLEPPRGCEAHWYSSSIHIRVSLLCWSWYCPASRYAVARGPWYWGIIAREAWAFTRDRACFCSSWLWVQSQTWACTISLLAVVRKTNVLVYFIYPFISRQL